MKVELSSFPSLYATSSPLQSAVNYESEKIIREFWRSQKEDWQKKDAHTHTIAIDFYTIRHTGPAFG